MFDEPMKFEGKSCAVVGNSGKLLSQRLGEVIDSHDDIIRCNLATTEGFEECVGSETTIRIANCHLIRCASGDVAYLEHLHTVFPKFDKYFLAKQHNIKIIVKPFPEPGQDVRNEHADYIKQIKDNGNELTVIDHGFMVECCKKVNTGDVTTGILAMIIACARFKKVSCFGFTFYDEKYEKHYYENMPPVGHESHNLTGEQKFAKSLVDEGLITWY